jgi:hypothetical protein
MPRITISHDEISQSSMPLQADATKYIVCSTADAVISG